MGSFPDPIHHSSGRITSYKKVGLAHRSNCLVLSFLIFNQIAIVRLSGFYLIGILGITESKSATKVSGEHSQTLIID